jgi:hypothetical protein
MSLSNTIERLTTLAEEFRSQPGIQFADSKKLMNQLEGA